MYRKHLALSALFFFVFVSAVCAQEYYARHYSVYDGLPSPEVYDVTQDSLGRIWFVTRGRLSLITYDGFKWRKIDTGLPRGHGIFNCISTDKRGNIWALDFNSFDGIFLFHNNKWKLITLPDTIHHRIHKAKDIQIIYRNGQPSVLILLNHGNLLLWENKKFYFLTKNKLPAKNIRTIKAINNEFYVLDFNGLYVLQSRHLVPVPLPKEISKEHFYSFCPALPDTSLKDKMNLLLLTSSHLVHLYNGQFTKTPLNFKLNKFALKHNYTVIPDGFGGAFIGSDFMLRHFNVFLKKWENIQLLKENKRIGITNIIRDKENNFWITSKRGIFKIPSLRFLNFTQSKSFFGEVTSVKEMSDGRLLVSMEDAFAFFDGSHFKTFRFIRQANTFIRVLQTLNEPHSNKFIAVVQNLGIVRIYPDGHYSVIPNVSEKFLNCIAPLPKSNSYLVGTANGLLRLSGNRLTSILIPALKNKYIRKIYMEDNGNFFAGTLRAGVFRISSDMRSVKQIKGQRKQANNIYAFLKLDRDRTLVGTYDGLYEIKNDSLVQSTLFRQHLPVFALLKDHSGNIWLGTNQGVFIIRPNRKIAHFDVRHGLSGMECNRDALYQDSQGRIWIGTNNGLSLYQPVYDAPAPAPELHIIKIESSKKTSLVHSGSNYLVFNLLCISFKDERNIAIRYRLKGWNDWQFLPKLLSPRIGYWQLPSGEYQFQIQAQNTEGKWSPILKSETLVIPTPFWKKWYFLAIAILSLIIFLYFIIFTYYKTQMNKELEREVEERTRALKESEDKYRQLFMDSLDGIFISTPAGKFLDVNPAGVKFFGYDSKEELLRVDIPKDLYANPEDRDRFKQEMAEKGHVHNFEADFKRKDGKIVTAVLSSTCVYDEYGNIKAYRGYIRDITEWKEMKQRLAHSQRMESLGLLAGGIAHDFNNILAGILGYASLMKMRMNQEDKLYRYVDIIEKSAQRAAELTNQLLIFSRRGQTKLVPVDLTSAIDEALKIIQSTFPKTIELIVDIEKDLPKILADPTQMQQILINLTVNARDALPDGEGKITISACRFSLQNTNVLNNPDAKPGEYVCLKVSDNGVGIPEALQQKIFEPFFSTKPKGKGTGMGLAMVYGALKNLGGFIQLDSQVNKGTTFSLFLPVRTMQMNESAETQNTVNLQGNENILVVDDEEMVRNFCKLALEKYGYRITLAQNGQEALDIFRSSGQNFDLIILDMIMPVLNGIKAYKKIRETNKTLRFLISSGYSDSDKMSQLKKDPLVDVIYKPYRANDLVQMVRKVLDSAKKNELN